MAHEYFGIDNDILWDIIQNKVEALQQEVRWMMEVDDEVRQE
jgi:uncharacterized protein with HEPN domain